MKKAALTVVLVLLVLILTSCSKSASIPVRNTGQTNTAASASSENASEQADASSGESTLPAAASNTESPSKGDADAHMPRQEEGMRYVYDGAGCLMKITSADNSLYYFPGDSSVPAEYQGSTFFVIDPSVNPSQNGASFNIDTVNGMRQAQDWVKKYVGAEKQPAILASLETQKGTKCLIYYEGVLS